MSKYMKYILAKFVYLNFFCIYFRAISRIYRIYILFSWGSARKQIFFVKPNLSWCERKKGEHNKLLEIYFYWHVSLVLQAVEVYYKDEKPIITLLVNSIFSISSLFHFFISSSSFPFFPFPFDVAIRR